MDGNLMQVQAHQFYAFLLVFARMSGVMTMAPLLGNKAVPKMVKAGLALVLSLSITPLVQKHVGPVPDHMMIFAGQIAMDAIFGLVLGYIGKLLFSAVEMAGYFIDTQIGFGFVNLIDPFSEQQSSMMSVFQYQLALTMYLMMNGHLMLIQSVVNSFDAIAPGGVSLTHAFNMTIVPLLPQVFALGFQLALPTIGVLVMMDLAFGLIARMAPQINVFIVGAPVKIMVGILTVAITLPALSLIVGQIIAGNLAGMKLLVSGS